MNDRSQRGHANRRSDPIHLGRTALAVALAAAACAALALPAFAEPSAYSPYAGRDYPRNLYWGDTHVHSSWSPDAGSQGNTKLGPDAAYQFARGDTVTAHNGTEIALRRPLDFLVVTDHSEYLGLYPALEEGHPDLLATENGKRWAKLMREGERAKIGGEFVAALPRGEDLIESPAWRHSMWQRVIENAERYNDPGRFTAFIGYEWTSMPGGANLHRNVIFRDGAERAGQVVPFSSIKSSDPEKLWAYLADYEQRTGGQAFAIPHNSNLSAGRMFELVDYEGKPFSRGYAEARQRYEPIVEATQIKGDSEAHPATSPEDEFADYESFDYTAGLAPGAHEDRMFAGEYVRPALGNGLAESARLGANPFEFGLIGSTDSHTSLATADEADFWGKFSRNEPHPGRTQEPWASIEMPEDSEFAESLASAHAGLDDLPGFIGGWNLVASGYAGVWARANTREALFDAMRRRETYATTGPRMVVRLFGGWDFGEGDAVAPDIPAVGYAKGVPMGGRLPPSAQKGRAPSFLVSALRDPEGANLDRVQIVKLWLEGSGGAKVREKIYDVAVSGGRKIGADGRARESVGNTVDVAKATYTNSVGAALLTAAWRDPDFDPGQPALYYVRVLEIPTPRWTTYDAAHFGTALPKKADPTTQERAYTSAIWYAPGTAVGSAGTEAAPPGQAFAHSD